jgi:hypothetical protein
LLADCVLDRIWGNRHPHRSWPNCCIFHVGLGPSYPDFSESGCCGLLCSPYSVSYLTQMYFLKLMMHRVVAAAASRLAYLAPVSPHDNPAFKVWISVVCTELQICLSISTACIPCIKPFFEGVEVCTILIVRFGMFTKARTGWCMAGRPVAAARILYQ